MHASFRPHVPGELGEPPARLSFSPPLPELDRGEPQMEGGVSGVQKARQREEWKRKKVENRTKQKEGAVVADFKK